MPGHIERKELIYMLILVGFVMGVFYFYKGQHFLDNMFRGQKTYQTTPKIIGNKAAATQAFRKKMEASLNDMLSDVFDEMSEYRKRRKILAQLTKPQNLKNAQYISESYQLANDTIPDLRARSNKIVAIFEQKDAEVKNLVKSRPPSAQKEIMQAWNKIKNDQVNLYVEYFAIEQDLLAQHQSFITFYYKHRNDVTYDQKSNNISLSKQELNVQATQISKAITTLKQKQGALTK